MVDLPNLDVGIPDKVSICVTTYRQPTYAKHCLESILQYTDYPDYEIIVSDDASNMPEFENYLRDIAARESRIKLFLHKTRRQVKNAMNSFYASEGQFTCWVNDDVEIPAESRNWLSVLVEFLKARRGQCASVTPAMYHSKTSKNVYWVGKRKEHWQQPFHDFLHLPFGHKDIPTQPVLCCYNTFACCLTWKGLVLATPLGKNQAHYGVDSDWSFEVERVYGLVHWMDPTSFIYHANIYNKRG